MTTERKEGLCTSSKKQNEKGKVEENSTSLIWKYHFIESSVHLIHRDIFLSEHLVVFTEEVATATVSSLQALHADPSLLAGWKTTLHLCKC